MELGITGMKSIECIVDSKYKLNKDGYLRRRYKGKHIFWHRHTWIQNMGEIPEGFEINHLCKNRACFNLEHLECIDGSEHAILTNKLRYRSIKERAHQYWKETNCSGTSLAQQFNRTPSTGCRWVREWTNIT